MADAEPEFDDHVDEQQEAVVRALNELTEIRAYTLAPDELRDFKAIQYGLRNLSPDHGQHDVSEVYND